jgi:hypothetical protein
VLAQLLPRSGRHAPYASRRCIGSRST